MAIQIFTTGGTIDKVYFDARSEYEVGEPTISGILRACGVTAEYRAETILRKDSLDITDEDRRLIVERVAACDADRILITHGTDTMVETARALQGISGKTIVLVGSLSPAVFRHTDAEFNIGFAFAVVQTHPPGVVLAMNGQVFSPERVAKNREMNRFEHTL